MAVLPAVLATIFFSPRGSCRTRAGRGIFARQTRVTGLRYAGLDARERHLAAEDGPLYAFIEKVRAKLPTDARSGIHGR